MGKDNQGGGGWMAKFAKKEPVASAPAAAAPASAEQKSFTEKAQKNKSTFTEMTMADGSRVFLVTGDNQNKKAWYYVLVEKSKLILFKKQVQTDFIDLSLYGTIIDCGWGEEPPQEVTDKIKKEYNL